LSKDIIDVDFLDIEKEVFLTAPDVAREIPDDEKRVRYWGDVFGDIKKCGVYKIDGRKKYTKQTIKAFKVIQKLIDDKQFTHAQVRDYVSKNGFEYISDNKNDLSKDLIGYNGLSSELSVELEQKLNVFQENIKNMLLEHGEFLKNDIKEQVALTVDEVVSDKLEPFKVDLKNDIKGDLKEFNSDNKKSSDKLYEQINSRFNDLDKKSEERDLKLVEKLRDDTKDAKIKALELEIEELKSNQHKGFFERIFGKKK
jgi:predicted secreted Zn-dependent protease